MRRRPAPGSPSREFIYAEGAPGNGLLASITGGQASTTTYFHDDHLDWRVSTDVNGNLKGQQAHWPFGESFYSTNGNEYVFTSYQRDPESGLDYALARYYDSTVARFCSADPLGGQPGDPQSWNRYAYARNNPITVTDPSGKGWLSWLVDAAIGILSFVLPEIAPSLFSAWGETTTWTVADQTAAVSTNIAGGAALGGASTLTTYTAGTLTLTSNISTVGLGGLGGLAAAGSQAPQQPTGPPSTPQQPQTAKNNCPSVPQHPQDADVDTNIRSTQEAIVKGAAAHNPNGAFSWWVNQVKPGAPWDYKARFPGAWRQWDDFGNFNYGATGSLLTDEKTLEQGATLARLYANPVAGVRGVLKDGMPWQGPNYGNDPHKNEMIRQGIKYRENHCGNF